MSINVPTSYPARRGATLSGAEGTSASGAARYVTEPGARPRPSFVTIQDQFTVDFAAEDNFSRPDEERLPCFPIVKDGSPVTFFDVGVTGDYASGSHSYIVLIEDALKIAAMEIAALRLVHGES